MFKLYPQPLREKTETSGEVKRTVQARSTFSNLLKPSQTVPSNPLLKMKYCPNCAGLIIQNPLARQKKKFCSVVCSRQFRRKVRPSYRHYKKSNCERCGSTRKLEVHHKNEDIRYNNPENLETLCRNCHRARHATKAWVSKRYRAPRKKLTKSDDGKHGVPFKTWATRNWGISGVMDLISRQRRTR